jgi:hypothetical protein
MRAFFGILGLAGAGFLVSSVSTVGCGSSNNGGSTGTAGTSGTGKGGTTGTAGTGQGQAGTMGGGGNSSGGNSGGGSGGDTGGGVKGCTASELAPAPAPLISDFSASNVDGGALAVAIGGTFTYASPSGAIAPTATPTNGGWHITLTAPGMDAVSQYVGVGIYFNGDSTGAECIDATPYTGIKFDISGTVGGTMCSMQYSTNDSAHQDSTTANADKKAGGPANAYAPQAPVTVTTAVQTITMPFVGTGAPSGGSPMTAISKDKLTGIQWQFTVGPGTTSMCAVDIVIDNVTFY